MAEKMVFPEHCSDAERDVLDQIGAAGKARVLTARSPSTSAIRAPFIDWLLRSKIPDTAPLAIRLELLGFVIDQELDLSGSKVKFACCFDTCTFGHPMRLLDSSFLGLELLNCNGSLLDAPRIEIAGQFIVRQGHFDTILLTGARVRGRIELSCHAGTPNDLGQAQALSADGLHCDGTCDLSGMQADGEVRLSGCKIGRDLRCHAARISNPGGWSLTVAGGEIEGSVYLGRRDFAPDPAMAAASEFAGSVHLEGVTVGGNIDARGARFAAHNFVPNRPPIASPAFEGHFEAIRAGSTKIGGSIKFNYIRAAGTVWLADVEVGGNFDCTNAWFDFPGETALWADGIQVTGSTWFSSFPITEEGKWVSEGEWRGGGTNGILRFVHASLERGLTIAHFHLSSAGVYGALRDDPEMLIGERDRRDIYGVPTKKDAQNVREPPRGACGVYAPSCKIGGRFLWHFVWTGRSSDRPKFLSLLNAEVDVLDYAPAFDNEAANWDDIGRLHFNNFEYREIAHLGLTEALSWLRRLDHQYAWRNEKSYPRAVWQGIGLICKSARRWYFRTLCNTPGEEEYDELTREFVPQPYLQLAKVVREAGYARTADEILLRLDRNRTRWGDLGVWRQIGDWLYDFAIQRGFAVFRPLILLILLWIVSSFAFHAAHTAGDFSAVRQTGAGSGPPLTQDRALLAQISDSQPLVDFNPISYAFELVVPVVSINQKQNWAFNASRGNAATLSGWSKTLESLAHWLVFLDPILGWIMTSFIVTGVAGLIRSPRRI